MLSRSTERCTQGVQLGGADHLSAASRRLGESGLDPRRRLLVLAAGYALPNACLSDESTDDLPPLLAALDAAFEEVVQLPNARRLWQAIRIRAGYGGYPQR
jgi:hypothetical protein